MSARVKPRGDRYDARPLLLRLRPFVEDGTISEAQIAGRLGLNTRTVARWEILTSDKERPVQDESFQKLKRLVEGLEAGHVPDVSRETPVNAPAPPTTYEAGALRGFIAGFRVASLRDRPVSEAEAREILDELVDDS